jgi:hypothetical protein
MSDGPDQERANILDSVRAGKMTPAQAELWAKANGQEPFERRPDVSALDPMKQELWTLPMAAAWFIWRSPHAVRDQWNLARKSWTKWIQPTHRLHKVSPRSNRRWDLKLFRRANLDDVFAQTRLHLWNNSQRNPQVNFGRRSVGRRPFKVSPDRNPYHRFKVALQSGKLVATHMRPGEQEGAQIPAEYWIAEFEEFEGDPLDFDLPGSPSTHDRKVTPSEEPFESPFAVDLSDMLDRESNDWEIPDSLFDDPLEGDFYVFRERVIEAEKEVSQEVSQREFERPDWGLGQSLGWLAYRNAIDFRSLGRAELNPPTYYGENYPPHFPNPQPVEALTEALISGALKGYRRGEEVAQAEWLHMAVWDVPDVKFRRDDVLLIGTDPKAQPPIMKVLPPDEEQAAQPSQRDEMAPYRTGAPGRPTGMAYIVQDFRQRMEADQLLPTPTLEAKELFKRAEGVMPATMRPTPKTIENKIRADHRKWRAQKSPKL